VVRAGLGISLYRNLVRSGIMVRTCLRRRIGASRLTLERLEDRLLLSFAAPLAVDPGAAPNAIAVGHFEGATAAPGVVTANANGTLSVLLSEAGTLQNPITLPVGGTPDAVAVGDFLGNGFDDIAAANVNGTVSVALSHGDGTFAAPKTFSVGATPAGVAVGDFNGDGKLDIATANQDGTVSVLPGDGKGGFGSAIHSQVGGTFTSVAAGAFTSGGHTDLVVGTPSSLSVLLSNGDGTFTVKTTVPFFFIYAGQQIPIAVRSVAVSDFQGDGKQDIVAQTDTSLSSLLGKSNSPVNVLLGNGDGTFATPAGVNVRGASVASMVVGDFTGDGKPDIVTSNDAPSGLGAPSLTVLAGSGNGSFSAPRTTAVGVTGTALAAGSFHGGRLDLVLASNRGSSLVTVLPNLGLGIFAVTPLDAVNGVPTAIASGDFTGDGKADLVTTVVSGSAVVLLNNGNGSFRPGPTLSLDDTPNSVAVGDFNGDHKQDIAVGTGAGAIDVFLGNGNGTFGSAHVISLGSNDPIGTLAVGDFNHDGRADLAVASTLLNNQETGLVAVLLSTGNGTFHRSANVTVGVSASGLAVADFNRDGNLDLATTTLLASGDRDVKLLLGNGNGTFAAPLATTPGGSSSFLAAGDFNGDQRADLVLVDYFHNTVRVLPGTGHGTFGLLRTSALHNPGGLLGAPVVGDFFGDHKASVALTGGVGTVSVLRGNGDATFQAAVNYVAGYHGTAPGALAVGDFNGDGKPDLAATDSLASDVSVLINTTPAATTNTPIATTTALSADVPTAVFGQTVTLTATVSSTGVPPTGTVTFSDGGRVLGEVAVDPNGHASFQVQLGVGVHALKASFAGLDGFTASAASLSETVNRAATTTALAGSVFSFTGGQLVLLSATITPVAPGGGSPTGTVTFFDGGNFVGTAQVSGGQATLVVNTLGPGPHLLTASYSGDADFEASTSEIFVLNV
jgi:hypothetical protein